MMQKMSELVSVTCTFDATTNRVCPEVVVWAKRKYFVQKLGLHHSYREGRTLFHVFSVETPSLFFRLVLNTDNLQWRVEEIADDEPN